MPQGIAVSDYGIDLSGTTTNRNNITNAPLGHTFYDTTIGRLFVWGNDGWQQADEEVSSSSSSSSSSTSSQSSSSSSSLSSSSVSSSSSSSSSSTSS